MTRCLSVAAILALAACTGTTVTTPSSTTSSNAGGNGGASTSTASNGTGGTATTTTSSTTTQSTSTTSATGMGGDAGVPDHDTLVAQIEGYCTPFAAWYCGMAPSCGCGTGPGWPGSTASCVQTILPDCMRMVEEIEANGFTFLPDRGAACLMKLQAAGNDACLYEQLGVPWPWGACQRALSYPPQTLGATCNIDGECAGGDGHCVNQVCKPHAALGASCANAACVDGAFCNAAKVCTPLAASGAACELTADCQFGLACSAAKTCAAPKGLGATCTNGDLCGAGTVCTLGVCQPSPTACTSVSECGTLGIMACAHSYSAECLPLAPNGMGCGGGVVPCASGICHAEFAGSTCVPLPGLGELCADHKCQPGLGCDVKGTFLCQPPAALGKPCNVGPDAVQCGSGLVCSEPPDNTNAHCVALSGAACQADSDCAAGERCSEARVCKPPVALGEACSAGVPCPAGHACSGGRCRKVVGAGATCPDDFTECAAGLACVTGNHVGHGTCQAPPGANERCDIDFRCGVGLGCATKLFAPGVCVSSVCIGAYQ